MPCCPRKMVLYSSTKFRIIKPSTNIPWLRGFDLGFWKSSKQIYRKLQNKEKYFGEFQGLPCFPRKMVLYLWTKFVIIKPWSIIQSLRRFHFGLWQTSNKFIGNSNIETFWRVPRFASLSQKNDFVFVDQICHYKALNQY